jgi:hypothetical protein
MFYASRMFSFLATSRFAVSCAVVVLLSACGGGGSGGGSAAVAGAPVDQGAPAQPAGTGIGTGAGTPPALPAPPPDLSPAPAPAATAAAAAATDTPQPPIVGATVSPATDNPLAVPYQPVTIGTRAAAALPDGATPCDPGICPPFSANGSVTNIQGSDNPTAAHAYLVAPDHVAPGGYPDLANLPTIVLPAVPVSVGVPPT